MEQYKENFYFITDKEVILEHIVDVKNLLSQSYWAKERKVEVIERSIKNSICFAILDDSSNKIIAFARVVTDYATMYYLADVIVDEKYRGNGIGKALLKRIIVDDSELQKLFGLLLTADAHTLYSQFGFRENNEKCMCKFKNS